MYVHHSIHFFTSDCCSLMLVKEFEKDDDPEAGLDESSTATYGCEEIQTPQAGASVTTASPVSSLCFTPSHIVFIHAHSGTNHGRVLELKNI